MLHCSTTRSRRQQAYLIQLHVLHAFERCSQFCTERQHAEALRAEVVAMVKRVHQLQGIHSLYSNRSHMQNTHHLLSVVATHRHTDTHTHTVGTRTQLAHGKWGDADADAARAAKVSVEEARSKTGHVWAQHAQERAGLAPVVAASTFSKQRAQDI